MRCRFVLAEPYTDRERPDAIGWRRDGSHLVECKISVADFYNEHRKRVWRPRGLGLFRWLMTPPGLLKGRALPPSWGLLEVHPKQVRRIVAAKKTLSGWNYEAELYLLAKYTRSPRIPEET